MANNNYISGFSHDDLFVPAKASTVYAAHEASLFLGGQLIPIVNAPNGVVKVPKLNAPNNAASTLSAEADPGVDLTATSVDSGNVNIVCDLIASRSVVRDLGNIDPTEIGRQLGNSVADAFDSSVATVMGSLTAQTAASPLTDIFDAVGTIRGNGETGALYGLVSADLYGDVMAAIGGASYAGGEMFQGQALRSGLLGAIAGVPMFVTSKLTSSIAVFGADAMRIAMQKNVDLEVGRRTEAVGFDVVASLHAKAALVDANRGIIIS